MTYTTPTPVPQSSSLTETAYDHLRAELVTGRLKPGEKLRINSLAEAQSMSPGAIREALSRLSAEGLVTSEPQRGFTVAAMSAAELRDITQVRIDIESQCLRRSMAAGDIEWESRVVGAYHALMRAPVDSAQRHAQPTRPWATAHAHFHRVLISACDSPWLLRLREQIYIQSERYRLASISFIPLERSLEDEHQLLLDAVLRRDADEAVKILVRHFGNTAAEMLSRADSPLQDKAMSRDLLKGVASTAPARPAKEAKDSKDTKDTKAMKVKPVAPVKPAKVKDHA